MKILDICADWVLSTSLFEAARKRKNVMVDIGRFDAQLAAHIIKIIYCPNSQQLNHWCKEINAWLWDIDSYRFNGKQRLEPSTYYHILLLNMMDNVDDLIDLKNDMIRQQRIPPITTTNTDIECWDNVQRLYSIICTDIATRKFTTIQDCLRLIPLK